MTYSNLVPGAVNFHRGYPCFDTMAAVSCGDRRGFGLIENAINTLGGKRRPAQEILVSGYIDNGIFPYRHGCSLVNY